MKLWRTVLGVCLLAIALLVLAIPSTAVFATDCVMPEACSSLAAKAAANFGASDPADYIKTWMFVNCDADGYFRGAMLNYNNCQATKAVEDKKLQDAADKKKEEEAKKNAEAKKAGKPYTTKMEFNKDVKPGDTITAKKNETIVIMFADGAQVVLNPNSSMTFLSDNLVSLKKGIFQFLLGKWKNQLKKKFEVKTSGAVLAIRGTTFLVNVKAVSTMVQLIEGTLDVSNIKGDKTIELNAGYSVVARKNGKISAPKAFDAEKLAKELGIDTSTLK